MMLPREGYLFYGQTPQENFCSVFYRIAALLALPLLGLIIYQYFHFSNQINILEQKNLADSQIVPVQKGSTFEYKVNPGVKGLIDLPDGSRVWLNSNSTLKCPQQFGKEKRELELSGEGYFIVESIELMAYVYKTVFPAILLRSLG